MSNSYGFSGDIPSNAIAAKYSVHNGEYTGEFYYTDKEAKDAENKIIADVVEGEVDEGSYSVIDVNDSGWVGRL